MNVVVEKETHRFRAVGFVLTIIYGVDGSDDCCHSVNGMYILESGDFDSWRVSASNSK